MRTLTCCVALGVFVLASGIARAGDDEDQIDLIAARANPILREALALNSPYPEVAEGNIEERYRESWIDNQIDYFVKQVRQKLRNLQTTVKDAEAARESVIALKGEPADRQRQGWRDALKKAEDQSRALRTDLANVLTDLRSKDKFQVKLSPTADTEQFEEEMKLLSEQVSQVEHFINDYLLKPTHVTSVSELKDANILDYLRRVEKIAKAVRLKL